MYKMLVFLLSLLSSVHLAKFENNITQVNLEISGPINGSILLPCSGDDLNLTTAFWKIAKSDRVIPAYPVAVESSERIYSGHNFGLFISRLFYNDSKTYTCTSYMGSEQGPTYVIKLKVSGPPDPPTSVKAEPQTENKILVTWVPGSDNNSPIHGYRINFYKKGELNKDKLVQVNSMPSYELKLLEPFTTYQIKVQALNSVGHSAFTNPVTVQTLAGRPTIRPKIHSIVPNKTFCTIAVSIDLDYAALRGQMKGYAISVQKKAKNDDKTVYNISAQTGDTVEVKISHLTPFTEFEVKVHVFNGRYQGAPTVASFTTLEDIPGKTEIKIKYINSSKFTVHWEEPKVKNGQITGYVLMIYQKTNDEWKNLSTVSLPSESRRYTFSNLSPLTQYNVSLVARNKAGPAILTSSQEIRTDIGRPPAPELLSASILDSYNVLVNWTWSAPSQDTTTHFEVCSPNQTDENCFQLRTVKDTERFYCYCDKAFPFMNTTVPLQFLHYSKGSDSVKVLVRVKQRRLFCGQHPAPDTCFVLGPLSNPITIQLDDAQMAYLENVHPYSASVSPIKWYTFVIIAVAIFLLTIFLLIGLLFFIKKRRSYTGYEVPVQQLEVVYTRNPQMTPFSKSPYPPIPIANLSDHVFALHADDDAGYQTEFENIDRSVRNDWLSTVARFPDNMPKNRYSNVFAYDHSRVCLQNLMGRKSDYINANYIDGYHKPRAYIATQGALPSTFGDFWQMIWEQGSNVIVMISNFTERGRRKCDPYWPDTGSVTEGCITIRMISQTDLAFFTIRVFGIRNKNKKSGKERIIYHYHYTDWRDFDVPSSPLPVLVFVRHTIRHATGPIVVHCSAGVGRTGTYICIESLIRQMEKEHQVNIRGFLEHIRQQRMKLVQTEQQYAFIHDTLREYLICPEHQVAQEHLAAYLRCLKEEEPCGCTRLQKQFQLCVEWSAPEHHYIVAKKPWNLPKSRDREPQILPITSRRVFIPAEPGVEGSDYINASHLNGYWTLFEYIVTQHPMETTEASFWKMVWDENCSIIILLSPDLPEEFPQFWPSLVQENREIGWLRVGYRSQERQGNTTRFEFLLSSSREDYALECHLWWVRPEEDPEHKELLRLTSCLSEIKRGSGPTLVVDQYGGSTAGLFCALNTLIHQVNNEGVVDVYFIFKMFHLQRPNIWSCHTDLEKVYSLIETYLNENSSDSSLRRPMVNGWLPDRPISPVSTLEHPTRLSSHQTIPDSNGYDTLPPPNGQFFHVTHPPSEDTVVIIDKGTGFCNGVAPQTAPVAPLIQISLPGNMTINAVGGASAVVPPHSHHTPLPQANLGAMEAPPMLESVPPSVQEECHRDEYVDGDEISDEDDTHLMAAEV